MRKQCSSCVNDTTVRNIKFNKDGVCNFCESYYQIEDKLTDYDNLNKLFLEKVVDKEKKYTYDVALGFSGGKDSTYVLYKLIKDYKLRVKAYTLDNGFLSAEARQKIDALVTELGVEHEYVVCDLNLLKSTYKQIVSKYLSPCIACSFLGYAVMLNYASSVDAYVGIHGRSIPQMFRNYANDVDDVFKPFIIEGLSSECNTNSLVENVILKIEKLIDKKLANDIKTHLLKDGSSKGFRDFVAFFLYHEYDKNEIIDFLEKNTSWKVIEDDEHFDCLIHNGAMHIKNIIARRSHLMPELSVLIRQKKLTKDKANVLMNEKTDKAQAVKELKMLCKFSDLNYLKIIIKAKIYGKRWW